MFEDMPVIPVITPVRLARLALAGLVIAGMAGSGIAMAAGWSGPSSPAPLNNTPELIWNAQETGFTPQDASFSVTGSGVLGTFLRAGQIAAGGYDPDAGGIAITTPTLYSGAIVVGGYSLDPRFAIQTPSMWVDDLKTSMAYVGGDLLIDPVDGSLTLGGETRSTWPVSGGGDVTGVSVGPNLVGGGSSGEISIDLSGTPTVDTLAVNNSAFIPDIAMSSPGLTTFFWNSLQNRLDFNTRPHFMQGFTTQIGTTAAFSGPVYITGSDSTLSVASAITSSSLCAGLGASCGTSPLSDSGTVAGQRLCIGSDCRTSWPAGGGGSGTVTSVGSGTGLIASPNPITGAGTISFDQAYGDGRYVNAAGDLLLTGDFRVTSGSFDVRGNGAGTMLRGINTGAGQAVRGENTGSGFAVFGEGASGTGVSGISGSGIGVRGFSGSYYGVLGQGSAGARFLNGGATITTDISSGTDGVNSNGRIIAPQFCIGASCISSWPTGGAGTVTSISQGAGITATPNPIVGTGTIALDTAYADGRYINSTGPDQITGGFTATRSDASAAIVASSSGTGSALYADNNSGSNPAIFVNNLNVTGSAAAGYFANGSGLYTYLAWGGTNGVYTNGTVRGLNVTAISNVSAANMTLGGVTKAAWPAERVMPSAEQTFAAGAAGWQAVSCASGEVVGVVCFHNTATPAPCPTRRSGETGVQIYRHPTAVTYYTLYCSN